MVKDHFDSERGNPLCHMGYSFRLTARVLLYALFHRRERAQWVHPMKDRSNDPSHHERTLLPGSYISLPLSRIKAELKNPGGNKSQVKYIYIYIYIK